MNPRLPRSAQNDFERAVALASDGRVEPAEAICADLIERFPREAEIAHFGGVLASRMGRYEAAVQRLARCLEVEPRRARARAALGFALERLDRLAEARQEFSLAAQSEPRFAEAHNGIGITLLREGRAEEALASFERAIALEPRSVEARLNAGRALQRAGRDAAAAAHYAEALVLAPHRADVARVAALGLLEAGALEYSVIAFRRVLESVPGDALTRSQLALALDALGRTEEAWSEAGAALRAEPPQALVHNAYATLLLHSGRWAEAEEALAAALALDPKLSEARINLAMAQRQSGKADAALASMREGESDAALDARALARLGAIYGEIGESDKAIELAERALASSPDLAGAHGTLAVELLRNGALERGWHEHAYRPTRGSQIFEDIRAGRYPPRLPASLAGRDVCILAEQGLGDVLFFLRFAKPLADEGARLQLLGADPRLETLLRRALPLEYGPIDHPRTVDALTIWAGDLPAFVGPLTGSGVCPSLAIEPQADRVRRMRERIGASGVPAVGIAWRAGTTPRAGPVGNTLLSKEIAPRQLGRSLAGAALRGVVIQRAPRAAEIAALEDGLGAGVLDLSLANDDLEDLLALCAVLEDYVGVSNTSVHLRAATGRGGHILVPYPPDWRWQRAGESIWFPGFATYREAREGGWDEALARLRRDLAVG